MCQLVTTLEPILGLELGTKLYVCTVQWKVLRNNFYIKLSLSHSAYKAKVYVAQLGHGPVLGDDGLVERTVYSKTKVFLISKIDGALTCGFWKSIRYFITKHCDEIKTMLLKKNEAYGDSALKPVRVFSKSDADEQIKVRIDDKLNRLMQGKDILESDNDVIKDLVGYLILLLINQDKNN